MNNDFAKNLNYCKSGQSSIISGGANIEDSLAIELERPEMNGAIKIPCLSLMLKTKTL